MDIPALIIYKFRKSKMDSAIRAMGGGGGGVSSCSRRSRPINDSPSPFTCCTFHSTPSTPKCHSFSVATFFRFNSNIIESFREVWIESWSDNNRLKCTCWWPSNEVNRWEWGVGDGVGEICTASEVEGEIVNFFGWRKISEETTMFANCNNTDIKWLDDSQYFRWSACNSVCVECGDGRVSGALVEAANASTELSNAFRPTIAGCGNRNSASPATCDSIDWSCLEGLNEFWWEWWDWRGWRALPICSDFTNWDSNWRSSEYSSANSAIVSSKLAAYCSWKLRETCVVSWMV